MCAGNKACKECSKKQKSKFLDFDGEVESIEVDGEFDDFGGGIGRMLTSFGEFLTNSSENRQDNKDEKLEAKADDFASYNDCMANKPLTRTKSVWKTACENAHLTSNSNEKSYLDNKLDSLKERTKSQEEQLKKQNSGVKKSNEITSNETFFDKNKKIILISGSVLLLGTIGFFIIKKRKKK